MASSLFKAKKAKEIVLKAARDSSNAHIYFGRKFDNLFEEWDGFEVVKEFVKLHKTDESLQNACKKVDHFIGIESWIGTVAKHEPISQPTLF